MDCMRVLYQEVDNKIKRIDFEMLWKGFHKYEFALYTEEKVYLEYRILEVTDAFMGNTAIEFEGKKIAIWKIDNDFWKDRDTDILAADLIHEMFHAFQLFHGESRFPNDMKALDYPQSIENFDLKLKENKVLVNAYKEKNGEERSKLLSLFCRYRSKRQDMIGDVIAYEYMVETIEGMAEYIGTKALRLLSEEKYELRMERYTGYLETISPMLFDIRRVSYFIGVTLLIALSEGGFSIYHDISKEKRSIFALLVEQMDSFAWIEPSNSPIEEGIKEEFLNMQGDRRLRVASFFNSPYKEVVGEYSIIGYDPMNMYKVENKIYGKTFWMLKDEITGEHIFIKGEGMLLCSEDGRICKCFKKLN